MRATSTSSSSTATFDPGLNDVEITAVDTAGNSTTTQMQVDWQGNTNTPAAGERPGRSWSSPTPTTRRSAWRASSARRKTAGRRVYVAIVTNGDSGTPGSASGYCGAASRHPCDDGGVRSDATRRDASGDDAARPPADARTSPRPRSSSSAIHESKLEEIAASGTGWDGRSRPACTAPMRRTSTARTRRVTATSATSSAAPTRSSPRRALAADLDVAARAGGSRATSTRTPASTGTPITRRSGAR